MTMQNTRPRPGTESVRRLERPVWRRRLRAWRPWLIAILVVAVLSFAGWVMLFSTWLGLQQVKVEGNHRVSAAEVTAAAQLTPGTPLARINIDAVQARVDAIPAVKAATVHRGWPHTVVITVTERTPVASVHTQQKWWLVDSTGVRFASSGQPNPDHPIIELDGQPGQQALRDAATVVGALPPALASQVKRVSASSIDSITLHLTSGAQVRWGGAADSAEKAAVLAALLPHKAAFYDVSVPSQPATRG